MNDDGFTEEQRQYLQGVIRMPWVRSNSAPMAGSP